MNYLRTAILLAGLTALFTGVVKPSRLAFCDGQRHIMLGHET